MLFSTIGFAVANMIYLALHVINAGSFPQPLSEEEEVNYLQRWENGDMEARDVLVERNLRLVAHIIKKYYSNAKDQNDLISIGTIGLIKAVSTFSTSKGTRLATYAARCIENEILMYFRNQKKSAQDVYINEAIDSDKEGNALTLMDIIACEDTIIDDVDTRIKIEKLNEYIRKLSLQERKIIELRYGLYGKRALPQREVAKIMNISRSYVSRIEKRALLELRKMFPDESE